ncbi:hypothetical protein DACRYDRAFT_110829 [Dacryopinax primogenitus]|uniref:Cupin type-2 domain-containing protein n=1 Tax=Dacryopinax primogenitus (strain DJM 731) TaxID=1858805 RepID=M5G3Q0_DACPD|nr:uncharacterized protein DACRYDRAFT_110829 [Dacryopinax primogenitus]EJT98387.1 hypothetical protein DACRYDRAFT_110829 [Dacryopinax primogenitus]
MTAEPHTRSDVHHHDDQGHGAVLFNNGKERVNINPGDFALNPAGVEHQELNDGEEQVVWLVVRSGSAPKVVNLDGCNGNEKK